MRSTRAGFSLRVRNPDVLTCIANLSNDEVFTPPEIADRMLDTLADAWASDNGGANIWADPTVRFLDPCTKSGVFLREIASRLVAGLKDSIPDLSDRVDHILTQQVYGIGITRLTSLMARRSVYCSKWANGPHSIAKSFTTPAGNIWFNRVEHSWSRGRCTFCGAAEGEYRRSAGLETHAYAFIHNRDVTTLIPTLFGGVMQFDVIIGNPPYQLGSDGGTRDIPIYQKFVEQAKRLGPRYVTMVIPARWMASGLGLSDFRERMLNDRRIRALTDYPVAREVFPSVEVKGGICYFLWDRSYDGDCAVTTVRDGTALGPEMRDLREFDVMIRDVRAVGILRKVLSAKEPSITSILSVDKEFGWTSNFTGFHTTKRRDDVTLHYVRHGKRLVGYIAREGITKSAHLIDTWKVMVPKAGSDGGQRLPDMVLGRPLIAEPPSVCTQTYLFFNVASYAEARSLESYLRTRFFRFLVSLRKITQDATRSTYKWVPVQSWTQEWTDGELCAKYGLSPQEYAYIESVIAPMENNG